MLKWGLSSIICLPLVSLIHIPSFSDLKALQIKEKETHLHYFPTFESLKNKVNEALIRFDDLKGEILSFLAFTTEYLKKRK